MWAFLFFKKNKITLMIIRSDFSFEEKYFR